MISDYKNSILGCNVNEMFAKNTINLCKENKIRIQDLEKELKIPQGYLSRISHGKIKVKLPMVAYISKKFNIDINKLVFDKLSDEDLKCYLISKNE